MSKQGLTPKQEKFAQGIASGMNQADAYRAAFDAANCSDKTIHEKASRLANDGKVRNAAAMARCVELKSKLNGLMVEDRKNQRRPLEELTDDQLTRGSSADSGAQPSVH
jgi:phage terminase small subunit